MKKVLMTLCCACVALMMTSCYQSTVCVGTMKPTEPAVAVKTVHNPHFIGGLVGHKQLRGKNYVNGETNYKVKHYLSFVDYLLSGITMGIYTPSTTKFYVPMKAVKSKKNRRYDDDDDDDDDD